MDYPLVEIIWEDSWSDTAQLDVDAIYGFIPAERSNVGYLLESDKTRVIITSGLVQNLYLEKVFTDGIVVFPRSMVKEIREI